MTEAERYYYTHFEAEKCSSFHFEEKELGEMQADFRDYTEQFSKKTFKAWDDYNIVCPKLDDNITVKGT